MTRLPNFSNVELLQSFSDPAGMVSVRMSRYEKINPRASVVVLRKTVTQIFDGIFESLTQGLPSVNIDHHTVTGGKQEEDAVTLADVDPANFHGNFLFSLCSTIVAVKQG
jgi:hypothetical protein